MRGTIRVLTVACALAACGNPSRNGDNGNGHPDGGADCTMDGAHRCNGSSYETCVGGQWMSAIDCPQFCDDKQGCIECVPGQRYCKDGNVWTCADDGTAGSQSEVCTGINVCEGGTCVDACADAAVNKSYVGCDYEAVDLDNAIEVYCVPSNQGCQALVQIAGACTAYGVPGLVPLTLPTCLRTQGASTYTAGRCDPPNNSCPTNYTCNTAAPMCVLNAQYSPFAVVVSNPQSKDAHVTLTGPGGQVITKVVTAGQVTALLPQAGSAIPDQSLDGTLKAKRAYHLSSDLPIVAYQFNPLDNVNVFSNDASLLIPSATFDTEYYAMSWPTLDRRLQVNNPMDRYYGYITVVAASDNTQIAVTPTAVVQASATQQSIAAGTTTNFTLNAGEVLNLEAAGSGDLTGTHVVSTNMVPFGAFGGHMAAQFGETTPPDNQHTRGPCCADHLEEMLFPTSTWGKTFAIARSKQRTNEPDLLRIMALKPNTTVAFTPAPSSGTCGTLGPGQFCDVKIQVDTEIVASDPVLVGQYLESSIWQAQNGGAVGSGDPSLAIAAPSEQFRKEYTILVPAQYTSNYASIAAAATGGVTVERITPSPASIPVTLSPFPAPGTHRAARVPLSAGQYKITCADGCGISIYGYSDSVSYMFAGGLDLKPIVIF